MRVAEPARASKWRTSAHRRPLRAYTKKTRCAPTCSPRAAGAVRLMMRRRQPLSRRSLAALVILGASLGLAGSAAAEPRLGADRGDLSRQLTDLKRRARELDDKIHRIEAELARDAAARPVAPRSLAAARPSAPDCRLPYYLDTSGIRHLRPECLEPDGQPSCDPPYSLDEQGLRRFRPACASDATLPSGRGND